MSRTVTIAVAVFFIGVMLLAIAPRPADAASPYWPGRRIVNVGCVGNCGGYIGSTPYYAPGYAYIPGQQYYYTPRYNYSYVMPRYNYSYTPGYAYVAPNYNYNYNYAYVAPRVNFPGSSWGSFGSYQNWANAFLSEHGRWPNQQDVNDFWWSQGFAATYGYSPFQ